MVLELHELGYQSVFLNSKQRWLGATWMKKSGYSSLVSSSTTKSGTYLNISETVLWTQLFPKLVLMGHFALIKQNKYEHKLGGPNSSPCLRMDLTHHH